MTANIKNKSDAFEAIHSSAKWLYRSGTINKATMREFDDSCLDKIPAFNAKEIKRIRKLAHTGK